MDKPPSLIQPQLLEELASLLPRLEAGGDPEPLAQLVRKHNGVFRVRGGVNRADWKRTAEFKSLMCEPDVLAAASPLQIAKLSFVPFAFDRFCGGLLEELVRTEFCLRLARRAAVLHAEEVGAES